MFLAAANQYFWMHCIPCNRFGLQYFDMEGETVSFAARLVKAR